MSRMSTTDRVMVLYNRQNVAHTLISLKNLGDLRVCCRLIDHLLCEKAILCMKLLAVVFYLLFKTRPTCVVSGPEMVSLPRCCLIREQVSLIDGPLYLFLFECIDVGSRCRINVLQVKSFPMHLITVLDYLVNLTKL